MHGLLERYKPRPSPIEVIADRIRSKSKRGQRDDPWKTLLLVEGGGIAGIITAEMLTALAKYDPHLDSFDAAGANSAGVLNLAYFLSDEGDGHEIERGKKIYEMLIGSQFYDSRRLANYINRGHRNMDNRPPVIDMRYLIYDIMGGSVELNWKNAVNNDLPTTAYITNLKDASVRGEDLNGLPSQEAVLKTLKLTSTIPWFGDPGGHPDPEGTDGGVGSNGVSIWEALRQHPDATHILVLLSKPDGAKIPDIDPLKLFAGRRMRGLGYAQIGEALERWNRRCRANLRFMDSQQDPAPDRPVIQTVKVPRGRRQIGIMEQNIRNIRTEAPYGQYAIDAKLGRRLAVAGHVFP